MNLEFKFGGNNNSFDQNKRTMTWKDSTTPISRLRSDSGNSIFMKSANQRTIIQTMPLPLEKNSNHGENEQTASDNESKIHESFSSFLSSSIGNNVPELFDWAIDKSSIQSCRTPFECYCFPIHTPTDRKRQDNDCIYEVHYSLISDRDDEDGEDGIETIRPYVPFVLSEHCEYAMNLILTVQDPKHSSRKRNLHFANVDGLSRRDRNSDRLSNRENRLP